MLSIKWLIVVAADSLKNEQFQPMCTFNAAID